MAATSSVKVEYIGAHSYTTALSPSQDPFRHSALANSHNHHDLHPWGKDVLAGTAEFDSLYAEANNRYMYHLWYTPALAPYMATEVLQIAPIPQELMTHLLSTIKTLLQLGVNEALQSSDGQASLWCIQTILESSNLILGDKIFVRLSATSTKDSFAVNVPTTKPDPLSPDANHILRRLLTSGRSVGRLLSLSEHVWASDPGEAIIVQRWSPDIELAREIRVFCCKGRVTAISQDVWWEKMGWRDRYSDGFVPAITAVWDNAKSHLPFDTCTMDVFVTPPSGETVDWKAQIIEFNGFGARLNTGSDLFHWVNDHDILYGERPGITVRFVDDWEDTTVEKMVNDTSQDDTSGGVANQPQCQSVHDSEQPGPAEPDWLVLEKKLRQMYHNSLKNKERLEMEERTNLPLRGRWCSAY
ncbi:hypothetical protein H9Q72_011919 [Fusarium xylarioides]|uniref:Cell division cycle protein 123 n=1 Tax=Fusarium xylarioides TaxID=221167 RepID=A0A9P7HMW8_9HYPO|nr:hypothetical protein H9Q72_011919 [Fusarium xylarioides]